MRPPAIAVAMTSMRLSTPDAADALGAEDLVGLGVDEELERHRLRARVVAGVRGRVRVERGWGGPAARSRFSFQPVVATWRPKTPTIAVPRRPGRVPGRPVMTSATKRPWRLAGLASGTSGLRAVERVALLDGVADRVDVRVARAELVVDRDAPARPDGEAGGRGEARLGPHADGRDHDVGGEPLAVESVTSASPIARHRGAQVQRRPGPADAAMDGLHHLGVERRHHLVGRLDEGRRDAAVDEVLDHLEADEPAADHDRRPARRRAASTMASMSSMSRSESVRSMPGMGGRTGEAPGERTSASYGIAVSSARREVADDDLATLAVDARSPRGRRGRRGGSGRRATRGSAAAAPRAAR